MDNIFQVLRSDQGHVLQKNLVSQQVGITGSP